MIQCLCIYAFIMVYSFFLLVGFVLFFLAVRKFRHLFLLKKNNERRSLDMLFIRLSFPRNDSREGKERESEGIGGNASIKEVLDVFAHFYNSLHAMYKDNEEFEGEDFFSCEMVILEKLLNFYVVIPKSSQLLFEKQLSAFYPDIFLDIEEDYNIFQEGSHVEAKQFTLKKDSMFPLKTYKHMGSDPFNAVINVMSKLASHEGAAVQLMLRPVGNGWQDKGRKYAKDQLAGKKEEPSFFSHFTPKELFKMFWKTFVSEDSDSKDDSMSRNTSVVEEKLKIMEEKNIHVGYEFCLRLVASASTKDQSKDILHLISSAYHQYSDIDGNEFKDLKLSTDQIVKNYILRTMDRGNTFISPVDKAILISEEIASIFHFPTIKFNKSAIIKWQEFKMAPPPSNLPETGVMIGRSYYRGEYQDVRILREDRRRHFYLIGKSGTGKSTLLEEMFKQDLNNGEGLCIIDPHGDLVETALRFIPRHRADDVIYFNPGDMERPMGLNMLEADTPDQKEFMAQEALAIFIKMYGEEIMGPRLQNYFRNGVLTLMADDDDPATIIDIIRLYTDDAYREEKSKKVTNPAVRSFWDQEYANTGQRERQEIVPYFAAKFTPFVTNVQMRNIIGQAKSGFDFRDVMDNKKILLVNLSKGKLGELNARLLGMIIVAKIQMAAMGRVDTPEDDRIDFYLYVDEFQNFVTESFASILSEARKYKLNLIIAHQYISQITKLQGGGKGTHEDTTIRDAVFGNVGTMMCFKIGAADSETMAKEFAPVFSEQDMINIAARNAYIKLNIRNTTSQAFSLQGVKTFDGEDEEAAQAYIQLSRLKFARDRKFVDKEITRKLL